MSKRRKDDLQREAQSLGRPAIVLDFDAVARLLRTMHAEAREAEGRASERVRPHGGGFGGLSGADHQMPAGERAGQGVIGVKSSGEGAAAALLEFRSHPVIALRDCIPTRYGERQAPHLREAEERRPSGWPCTLRRSPASFRHRASSAAVAGRYSQSAD